MVFHRAHGVIADSGGNREAHPGWVGEEGVEGAFAAIVQVDVDSAVVVEDEIADCVGALNRKWVGVEGVKKPGVVFCYEGAGFFVGPKLLLC